MTEGAPLVDRIRRLVADVQAITTESEARLAYRREHSRELSAGHKEALNSLHAALQGLADRVGALLAPAPDPEALRGEYERLVAKFKAMED